MEKKEECGCEHVLVNGKWIHICCEKHDKDSECSKKPQKISKTQIFYDL